MTDFKGPDPISHDNGREWFCGETGCDRSFPTQQGTKAHWSREHKPKPNGADANDIFERAGRAIEVLFPDVVMPGMGSRIPELAKVMDTMLKAVARS